MEISLIAAKVLGVYLVVSGLFMIFRGKTLAHMINDLFEHPAVLYLAGVILIFLSVLFLLQGNVWDGTWRNVITLIAWATLFKGIAYILFPDVLRSMISKKLMDALNVYGVIAVIAGIYLYLYIA
jgi:cytochrome bd-type quinol oxidase subunit 2